eukprot:Protomagalhaensia_wolfi_Nauph_80__200@NODE_1109_length_1727_cov_195_318720_g844_i0_p1_GENE_NODE_1109_length_1727_cov_195_318720_g844_i0NODE_1109_length_1727_cov_195_318720_g844_i0_p1_ORF_typecomplete_len245_score47_14_NODE_1109_length_1727_cov_195_318720_g844_i05041238
MKDTSQYTPESETLPSQMIDMFKAALISLGSILLAKDPESNPSPTQTATQLWEAARGPLNHIRGTTMSSSGVPPPRFMGVIEYQKTGIEKLLLNALAQAALYAVKRNPDSCETIRLSILVVQSYKFRGGEQGVEWELYAGDMTQKGSGVPHRICMKHTTSLSWRTIRAECFSDSNADEGQVVDVINKEEIRRMLGLLLLTLPESDKDIQFIDSLREEKTVVKKRHMNTDIPPTPPPGKKSKQST